jgi:hypothetical protein
MPESSDKPNAIPSQINPVHTPIHPTSVIITLFSVPRNSNDFSSSGISSHVKEDEVSRACSTNEGDEECI